MKIASTQFSLDTNSLEIYVSGCNSPHCVGCHNSELWNFDIGTKYTKYMLKDKLNNPLIDKIFIMGGEPLHQKVSELIDMLECLNKVGKPIYLFTRYELEDVDKEILDRLDYIKTGEYIQKSKSVDYYGITLASDNQKIIKLR